MPVLKSNKKGVHAYEMPGEQEMVIIRHGEQPITRETLASLHRKMRFHRDVITGKYEVSDKPGVAKTETMTVATKDGPVVVGVTEKKKGKKQ